MNVILTKKYRHTCLQQLIALILAIVILITHPLVLIHAQESTSSGLIIVSQGESSPSGQTSQETNTQLDQLQTHSDEFLETATQSGTLISKLPTLKTSSLPVSLTNKLNYSARLKKPTHIRTLQKKLYRSNESVSLTIEHPNPNQKVTVMNKLGQSMTMPLYRNGNSDKVELLIPPPQQFTPGTFTLTVSEENTILSSQDFSWGVLAINSDQSVYKTLSKARFGITVLNDLGETICTSSIMMRITDPTGMISNYSTENSLIQKDEQCGSLAPDAPDDYVSTYQIGETEGEYLIELTAITETGPRTIQDSFTVSNSELFYIKRSGPTRIYPPNWYDMTIEITASESFTGLVTEAVPSSFTIKESLIGQSFSAQSIKPASYSRKKDFLSLVMPFDQNPVILNGFGDPPPPEVEQLYEQAEIKHLDGVDFALTEQTPIKAVDDGVVIKIGSIYETTVVIQHTWGKSYYGYLSAPASTQDTFVKAGDVIGYSGKPQLSQESYLHFAMKRNESKKNNGTYGKIDPLPYLSKGSVIASENIKTIEWDLNIGKGETKTISYSFKTPMISPQFYLAGPLRFYSDEQKTVVIPDNTNEALFQATPSAQPIEASQSADPRLSPTEKTHIPNPVALSVDENTTNQFLTLFQEATTTSKISDSSFSHLFSIETSDLTHENDFITSSQNSQLRLPEYTEPRAFQIAADAVPTNLHVNTVELYAGQYSGNGTTGQNSNTNQTFSTFNFNIAEENVTIREIIIYFEAQYAAYEDDGDHTGWDLSFDACVESCTANAWSGSGQVTVSDNSILSEDESESVTARLLANVASETTMASYTGGGTNIEAQVGYRIDAGAADNSIAQAKAKLFVTYTYSPGPTSTNYTNTVRYPLESTQAGDQGTRRNSIAGNCTRNSTCPLFDYNVDLGEASTTEVSSWFRTEYFNDSNGANDIIQNINIQGTDTNSSDVRLEAARGGAQGNGQSAYFSGVSGFAIETADQLEYYHSTGTIYGIGGEVNYTYTAPLNSTTKTKTVSFPFGTISNGSTTAAQSDTTTIYLPETGISIQKAWFRVYSTNTTSGAYNLEITSTVEGTSETAAVQYSLNSGNDVPLTAFNLFHVIDSSYYDDLENATATNGIDVTIETTANSTNIGGTAAELMITYHYTDDSAGYLTSAVILAGQQTSIPDDIYTNSGVDPYFPEQTGVKTVRAAALDISLLMSDTDGNAPQGVVDVDADINSGTCTNTVDYDVRVDAMNAFASWIQDVADNLTTDDSTTYNLCIENDGDTIDTSYGGKMNAILLYTYQVDLPSLSQLMRHGKWFANNGTKQAFTF